MEHVEEESKSQETVVFIPIQRKLYCYFTPHILMLSLSLYLYIYIIRERQDKTILKLSLNKNRKKKYNSRTLLK